MNRAKKAIRVLVADDHTVVRDGLVAIIRQEKDMEVVAEGLPQALARGLRGGNGGVDHG